jgi:hypothetical protein
MSVHSGANHAFTASFAESCIRKAVAERGLTPGLLGLADTKAEDEPRERPGYGIY